MKNVCTKYFGVMQYEENSVLLFPDGLPGFEQERLFLPIHQPLNEPIAFLQSLFDETLCFVTLPVQVVCPDYRLELNHEDLAALEIPPSVEPRIGPDLLCLTIISVEEEGSVTANLLAPIVVNLRTRRARQCILTESSYSHQHPLQVETGEPVCS